MGAFDWNSDIAFGWLLSGEPYDPRHNPNYRDIPLPATEPQPEPPRRTLEERAQVFIAEGLCPVCKVDAPEGVCDICGWELSGDRSAAGGATLPAAEPPIDEYAPAELDTVQVLVKVAAVAVLALLAALWAVFYGQAAWEPYE